MADLDDFAELRGLEVATLEDAGLEVEPDGWIAIPYPNVTGVWKWRFRNPYPDGYPKYLDEDEADMHLYNPALVAPNEAEIWIAEGEMDTLTLIELGLRAVGVHGTQNVKVDEETGDLDQTSRFKPSWRLLFEDSKVVIAFDNDEEGKKAGRRLARNLNGETV